MKNGHRTDPDSELDFLDQKIIAILSVDGRMAITDLAKQVGMSKTPCGVRVKRLINDGFILGFRAVLNPVKLDMSHIAFAEVKLHDTTEAALKAFNEAVQSIVEIEQCHMIAGSFDYLLKVRTKDITAYRRVLGEQISTLPHVASSSTYVTLEAVKEIGAEFN
ncbi:MULTISPECIES: Lrp/AsnC ligand binding domain-containing protein [unclassified Lentilitoribacter]|uniref:Lrp/AsnC ligand binding domain-containing protein n=1 Tax=unclassified Lentilitoribacter TaxID=2647570 RepID=UPI001FCECD7F|nr:Lrp/AsnC ligand binding domain-containing protein [Lentilitoribacter sp. Alg239-R112]